MIITINVEGHVGELKSNYLSTLGEFLKTEGFKVERTKDGQIVAEKSLFGIVPFPTKKIKTFTWVSTMP